MTPEPKKFVREVYIMLTLALIGSATVAVLVLAGAWFLITHVRIVWGAP